jgi:glycosyltransferase involved in cell wall biosynthesis
MKRKLRTKFIFDMRGFYADERVDGGLWPLSIPLYKAVYNFFKRKEIDFLKNADYTISLTTNAKTEILSWKEFTTKPIPIQIIPCCADLYKFSVDKIDQALCAKLRLELGYTENNIVISYLGSLGTWYMLDEMLDLFKVMQGHHPLLRFLFITADEAAMVYQKAEAKGISKELIKVVASPYAQVASYISLSQISMFFIKPVFSKKASSPTKQGELMAMGIPMICNAGVGDVDMILADTGAGIALADFSHASYEKASKELLQVLAIDKDQIKAGAHKYYSLEEGVKRYAAVYEKLLK